MLINNSNYKADTYTQDTVEDIAELCNHILDGDYGKLAEVKEVDLEQEIEEYQKTSLAIKFPTTDVELIKKDIAHIARHFYELGLNVSNEKDK